MADHESCNFDVEKLSRENRELKETLSAQEEQTTKMAATIEALQEELKTFGREILKEIYINM